MSYARKDFVRVFHPTAEEEYRNNPQFRRDHLTGIVSAGLTAIILVLAGFGFIHLTILLGGVIG